MTNEEIYKQAIRKATYNGFNHIYFGNDIDDEERDRQIEFLTEDYERPDYRAVIFSHDFAKAFWGKDYIEFSHCIKCDYYDGPYRYKAWVYHLQQMVLEEEPLKYLEKFIIE